MGRAFVKLVAANLVVALVSPLAYESCPEKPLVGKRIMREAHLASCIGVCAQRGVIDLNALTKAGFTGIQSPCEAPDALHWRIDYQSMGVKGAFPIPTFFRYVTPSQRNPLRVPIPISSVSRAVSFLKRIESAWSSNGAQEACSSVACAFLSTAVLSAVFLRSNFLSF